MFSGDFAFFYTATFKASKQAVRVETRVTSYQQTGAVVFEVTFPDGAAGTNTTQALAPGAPWGEYGPNTDGVAPFVEFPTFDLADPKGAQH